MSNKISEQFRKGLKNMNLSGEEKSVIRQSILNFVSENPVRSVELARPSFWSNIFNPKFNYISTMAILLIITILVGGGVAVGAEKALPGEVLYPVKIGVNEEVKGWFTVSEEAKANWEIERAQRRLEEAETLATDGSLDMNTREKIEANFQAHADQVKKRIEKFENKEDFHAAVGVSSKFETSLKAHQRILNRLTAESKEEVKKEVRPIHSKVKSEAKAWTKTRKNMESKARGNVNVESEDDDLGDNQDDDNDELEFETGKE